MFRKALEDVSRKEGVKVSNGSKQQRGGAYEDAGLNELAERYRRGDLSQAEYLEAYNEYMEQNPGLEDEDFFEGRQFDLDDSVDKKHEMGYNNSGYNLDSITFSNRYSNLTDKDHADYDEAKKGNEKKAIELLDRLIDREQIGYELSKLPRDTYLVPIVGSKNVMPRLIAEYFSDLGGFEILTGIAKSTASNSRSLSISDRMKEPYAEFINTHDVEISGKNYYLIDDNSTTGRTFKALQKFIEDNGGTVVGYYAMTVGGDSSEKMRISDSTWNEVKKIGIENLRKFAEREGINREISKEGLTEREWQKILSDYKNAYSERDSAGGTRSGRGRFANESSSSKKKKNGNIDESKRFHIEPKKKSNRQYDFDDANDFADDETYMDAVNRGDMDAAQRLVDEAADRSMPDSKARTLVGELMRMFHGTNADENFTVFDSYGGKFGLFGIGSYFTNNRTVAEGYTKKGKGSNPRVYEVYLNVKNPIDMDAVADKKKWYDAVAPDYKADFISYTSDATSNEDMFKALKELCADNWMYREEAYEYITNTILAMGYDSITHIGGGRFGKDDGVRHRVFITFDPEQVKSAEPVTYDNKGNVIPLSKRFNYNNPDIRYDFDDANDFAEERGSKLTASTAVEKKKTASEKKTRRTVRAETRKATEDRLFNKRELERLSRIKSELEDVSELTVEQVTSLWGEMRKHNINTKAEAVRLPLLIFY